MADDKFRRDLRELGADLASLDTTIAKRATAAALSKLARQTRDTARAEVDKRFTLRQARFIKQGIRSGFANPNQPVERQFAIAGAIKGSPLAKQEDGALLKPTSGSVRRVTTSRATGEGDTAYPRRRRARGRVKPGNMTLTSTVTGKGLTRTQRIFATVRKARKEGKNLFRAKLPGTENEGIFRIQGGRKNPQLVMMHRIFRRRLRIPARPWLEPAMKVVSRDANAVFVDALDEQMRKARLFKY